ncbi:MAG: enoyl-CoA hydratase/isomerase family protein [Chloroflexi bacterium]|nr:enoyl-CoA hydratase/isomerase family protein [Chloroflexota bacterium]
MIGAFETVLYEKRGPVARVTLNRPDKRNAFNTQMRDDLWEILYAVEHDPDVRAVVLRGAGLHAFCAGADLSEFGTAPSQTEARQIRWMRDVFGRFYGLSKPVVAALHGYVVGSGVELALLCDIRIASEDVIFSLPETSLGLIPAAGGTQTLPRNIGRPRALDMILRGRVIDATLAREWGLVSSVVPRSQLGAETDRVARQLGRLDQQLVAAAKESLRFADRLSLSQGLYAETRLARKVAARMSRPRIRRSPEGRRAPAGRSMLEGYGSRPAAN